MRHYRSAPPSGEPDHREPATRANRNMTWGCRRKRDVESRPTVCRAPGRVWFATKVYLHLCDSDRALPTMYTIGPVTNRFSAMSSTPLLATRRPTDSAPARMTAGRANQRYA